jgi:SAM-dependent methyltransferase
MPTEKELNRYYKKVWTTSDDVSVVYNIQAYERVKYLARHISVPPYAHILDIGSGHGLLFDAFKNNGVPGISFYATDPSPENIKRLNRKGIHVFPDVKSIGDLQFDLICICSVLEHVPNPVSFISDIIPYLKPGGHVFIDVPERDDTFKPVLEPHVTVFTKESLEALAQKTGLTPVNITGHGQRREVLITENKRSVIIKKGFAALSIIEDKLFPEQNRQKLYRIYKFDEEGNNRWWIRGVFNYGN